MAGWSQPTLDGSSIKYFSIACVYRWESGWRGHLDVHQEGDAEIVRMITFSELSSEQMCAALAVAMEQVLVLLGD